MWIIRHWHKAFVIFFLDIVSWWNDKSMRLLLLVVLFSVCVCVLFSVESHMHSFTRLLNEKFGLLRVSIYFPSFHGWNALHLPWFAMASHCYCIGNGFLIHIIIITHKKRRQKNEWTPHYNECEHLQSQVKDTYRTNERASARAMCMRSFRLAPCSECNCMCHVYVAGFYTL